MEEPPDEVDPGDPDGEPRPPDATAPLRAGHAPLFDAGRIDGHLNEEEPGNDLSEPPPPEDGEPETGRAPATSTLYADGWKSHRTR